MNRALLLVSLAFVGCNTPMNMSYDFGRAYKTAFQTQAALDRPSVAAAQYRLSGMEGTQIRLQAEQQAGDMADETENNTNIQMQQ